MPFSIKTLKEFLVLEEEDELKKKLDKNKKFDSAPTKKQLSVMTQTTSTDKNKLLSFFSKQLYQSLIDSVQFKYKVQDDIAEMEKKGADEKKIEKYKEMGEDQTEILLARAEDIEVQMIALAGKNDVLLSKAEEMAAAAKNLAGKHNQEFFEARAAKMRKDDSSDKKEDKKDKEEKKS